MLNREGVQCFMARPYEQNLNGSFWDEFYRYAAEKTAPMSKRQLVAEYLVDGNGEEGKDVLHQMCDADEGFRIFTLFYMLDRYEANQKECAALKKYLERLNVSENAEYDGVRKSLILLCDTIINDTNTAFGFVSIRRNW